MALLLILIPVGQLSKTIFQRKHRNKDTPVLPAGKISGCLLLFLCLSLCWKAAYIFAQEAISQDLPISEAENSPAPLDDTNTETALPEAAPVMEIKRSETEESLYSFELRDVAIGDLFRALAHDYKLNLLVDKEVDGTVTASLANVSLEEALETIAESQNLILQKKGNVTRVSPHFVTKIFRLKYIEAQGIFDSSSSSEDASSSSTSNVFGDLLSEKGKVFLGKQPNSIVVIDYPPNVEKVEIYLNEMDKKMARRVFKLNYLKAADVVGKSSTTTSSSESSSSSAESASSSSTGDTGS